MRFLEKSLTELLLWRFLFVFVGGSKYRIPVENSFWQILLVEIINPVSVGHIFYTGTQQNSGFDFRNCVFIFNIWSGKICSKPAIRDYSFITYEKCSKN